MSISTPQFDLDDKAEEPPIAPSRHQIFHRKRHESGSPDTSLKSRYRSYPSHSWWSLEQRRLHSSKGSDPTMTGGVIPPPTPSSPSSPPESPLKRPTEQNTTSVPVEGPLRRPSDDKEEVAFSDIIATFAVDVSGSTQGKVLEEEIDAIKSLCKGLSRDALTQAEVIPWNHTTQSVIRTSELITLSSSGGTDPNSLNTCNDAKVSLSKCSTWFLLTDGEIDPNYVRNFSKGICEASLHGAPCVIVLFGYKSARPSMCNVSVGLSVFSNAADCLFLFHDIDTTQVYIFQSKGRFNAVLPPGCREILLDTKTLWKDLPTFGYRQLFDLPLPSRQQLRPDDLLLQGGSRINLHDLYADRINPTISRDIMENDDNLKSVLLAAQLRGNDDDIGDWISKQKLKAPNILMAARPDANNKATILIQKILDAMSSKSTDHLMVYLLQEQLRVAHLANWKLFLSSLGANHELRSVRSTIVSDAMIRIKSNRNEMRSGQNSPMILAPISPVPGSFFPKDSETASSGRTKVRDLARMKSKLGKDAGLLYVKGYTCSEDSGFWETCSICGQDNVLLTVLLKFPPSGLSTPGFPSPGERKGLAYPLAMGSFPETDVLSSYVCCDSCAQTLIQGKIHLDDGEITAAIPLLPNAISGDFEQTTFDFIDGALQKRFHKSAVVLVFLSTIFDTLASIDSDNHKQRSRALKELAVMVSKNAEIPIDLSTSITGSTPRTGTFGEPRPLAYAIQQNLNSFREPDPSLLQYPVSGFVVMTLLAIDLGLSEELCKLAIWHRFLFRLVENHYALVATDESRAVHALQDIVQNNSPGPSEANQDPQSPTESSAQPPQAKPRISLLTLRGTHLLSDEELEYFQRLDALFLPVERSSSSALGIFLVQLSLYPPSATFGMDTFDMMRAREDLRAVFDAPHEL
jgi:hypothetical protein